MVPVRLRVFVALVSLAAATWIGSAPASAQSAQAQPEGVRFSSLNLEIDEGAESVRVSVERTGALRVSRLLVDFASESGSARGGVDYADTSGTLAFEVGESFKSFAIRVRNDAEAEEREQFTVRLSNVRGDAATVGPPTTIAIWDDDTPPFDPEAADGTAPREATATAARRPATARPAVASPPAAPARPAAVNPAVATASAVAARGATAARPATRPALRPRRAPASTVRRQVSFRQSPVTPFELRPATTGAATAPALPARVDPLLALLAGILLARVTAEVWFRSRVEAT